MLKCRILRIFLFLFIVLVASGCVRVDCLLACPNLLSVVNVVLQMCRCLWHVGL